MKKLFSITIFLVHSTVVFSQVSKKSTALDEIQRKIDNLNTRISSLASNKERSSITNTKKKQIIEIQKKKNLIKNLIHMNF